MHRRWHFIPSLANMPIQPLDPSDFHKYKGKTRKRLPIRYLAEKGSAAEQHRRGVSDMPTRWTEVLPKLERWIDHFDMAKITQILLIEVEPESAEMSWWYHNFFIEIGQLSEDDDVFIH